MKESEPQVRYDDIERHETAFERHPVKVKKKRVRKMKKVEKEK